MSNFIKHNPCPRCGSKDNLGEWDDGHVYCFGCGYYTSPTGIQHKPKENKDIKGTYLPDDADLYIPSEPLQWLKKYEITAQEINHNKILWSESKKYLCFPYFGQDNILEAWQGRYFGDNKEHPKWITYGKIQDHLKIFFLTDAEKEGIILVEDIVSAIKISRQYPCSPLFGSNADWKTLARYYRYTKKLILWLDEDKYKSSHKFASRATLLGFDARVIYTSKDPKEYNNEEIKNYVLTLN